MAHDRSGVTPQGISTLEAAILYTVAYADVFNYPLTREEIHWYLWGASASLQDVDACLHNMRNDDGALAYVPAEGGDDQDGFYTLPGRGAIVVVRQRRAAVAQTLWIRAGVYAHQIARLPFVRMVALTGSLAMGNVEPGADIDYLIVTAPKRLWLVRAMIILLGRVAAARGEEICPNYLLSENALVFTERDFYTAHEFAQMIPLYGMATYRQLQALNTWVQGFLPNTNGLPHLARKIVRGGLIRNVEDEDQPGVKHAVEAILRTRPVNWLEAWEMNRKLARFARHEAQHHECSFSPDCCKGHLNDHMSRTLASFNARLAHLQPRPLIYPATEAVATGVQEVQAVHV